MTAAFGGTGGSNLGTAFGRVRIDYESTGVAKATKDVESLQHSMVSTGAAAASSAKEISTAAGQINNFAAQVGKLNQKAAKNPVDGLGKQVQQEVSQANKAMAQLNTSGNVKITPKNVTIDQGALTKAMNDFKSQVVQGINLNAPVKISPKDVTIDATAFSSAIRKWQAGAQQQLSVTDLAASVRINPKIIDDAKKTGTLVHTNFCNEAQKIQECGDSAGRGFGARLLESGRAGASKAGSGIASSASAALGVGLKTGVGVAAAGVVGAVGAIGVVLSKGFSRLENIDEARNKLLGLGHSGKEVDQIMSNALESVNKTSFSLDQAASTAAAAVAAGIKPGQDLTNYLKEVADNAALAGTDMADMGYTFNQVAATGKLTGDVLQSLQGRGIPVLQFLAKEYGVTAEKASEMVSNGEVDFAHFREAMNQNAGAAAKMGNSIGGSVKNLGAAVARLGAGLLAPIFGSSGDQVSAFATAVQWLSAQVDKLTTFLKDHKDGVIDFWKGLGEGALTAGEVVVNAVSGVIKILGLLARGFADIEGFFGSDVSSLYRFSEEADKLSGSMNKIPFDKGRAALDDWAKKAHAATIPTTDLANAAGDAAPKQIALTDALEKLGVKSDAATKSIKGTNQEFHTLLAQLKTKGASQELLNTLTSIRQQYDSGGRAIESYAAAMDKLGDSTADANDKASTFIKSLQQLGVIPADDALNSYNDKFRELTDYTANLVDPLDAVGASLVNMDGTINSTTKNGSTLVKSLEDLRNASVALAASGQATPEQAYQRTTEGMSYLLNQFGITDPAQVQATINKYFPQNAFVDALKQAGDPKAGIQSLFEGDPVKIQSQLALLDSTRDDILKSVVGPDGQLHVPTVLDVNTSQVPGGVPPGTQPPPGPPPGPPPPPPKTPQQIAAEAADNWKKQNQYQNPDVPWYKDFFNATRGNPGQFRTGAFGQKIGIGIDNTPDMMQQWPGQSKDAQLSTDSRFTPALSNVESDALKNKDLVNAILAQDQQLRDALSSKKNEYEQQGKDLSQAYADGILSNDDVLREAIKKLAQIAADGLGHSPAKYGPLSGKGWVFYRGQTFTDAWAEGITSQADSVKSASTAVAQGSVDTFDEKWTKTIKDFQEISDFGKHLLDFGNQISNITLGVAGLANTVSGGRLFPKNYVKDPLFDSRRGSGVPGQFNPTPWTPGQNAGAIGPSGVVAQPGESARDFAHAMMPFFESLGFKVGDHAADQFGEHQNGAIDIMVNSIEDGNKVLAQVLSDPNTYGAIFNHQVYGYGQGANARPYTGDNPHTDHVHAFYRPGGAQNIRPGQGGPGANNGAAQGPSGGNTAPPVVTPPPPPPGAPVPVQPPKPPVAQPIPPVVPPPLPPVGTGAGQRFPATANQNIGDNDLTKIFAAGGGAAALGLLSGASASNPFAMGPGANPDLAAKFESLSKGEQQWVRSTLADASKTGGKVSGEVYARMQGMFFGRTAIEAGTGALTAGAGAGAAAKGAGKLLGGAAGAVAGLAIESVWPSASTSSTDIIPFSPQQYAAMSPEDRARAVAQLGKGTGGKAAVDLLRSQLAGSNLFPTDDQLAWAGNNPKAQPAPSNIKRPDYVPHGWQNVGGQYTPYVVPDSQRQAVKTYPDERAPDTPPGWYWEARDPHAPSINGVTAQVLTRNGQGPGTAAYDAIWNPKPPPMPAGSTAPVGVPTPTPGVIPPITPPPAGGPVTSIAPPQLPSALTNPGQQDIANYIISSAMAAGYSRDEANAFVAQAYGESTLKPGAFGANTGDASGGASGIFQFTPGTWASFGQGGNPLDAKANIDAYMRLAAARDPRNGDIRSRLAAISVGGPATNSTWDQSVTGASPFVGNFQPGTQLGSPGNPMNVLLPSSDSAALGSLPMIPPALADLAAQNPGLQNALTHNITNQDQAVASLQNIDSLIADQNKLNTPQGKAMSDALGGIKSNLQSQYGLKEAPSGLEQAQTMIQGMSGIASDVFGVFDETLQSIAATQDLTDTLVRGVANTEDINRMIDDVQHYITLAAKVFQTAGDITSFAGSFSGGADFGGTAAAGQALSMIGQALQAVNTAIDLGQEAYKITTKYVGRFLESWFGLPGANDIKYLLDTMTGQLKVYTSDNPEMKQTFNTLGNELGATYPGRPSPTNIFTIYQGPGQDPRDTMDDAMFSVRASGVGAFGYAN